MRIIGNRGNTARKVQAVASGTLASGDTVVVNTDGTVSVVATSSGTQSLGSPTVFESDKITSTTGVTYDSSAQKIVISYHDFNNSRYGTAIVGTVSGTSISFGSPVVFQTSNVDDMSTTFDSSNNKVVFVWNNSGSSCRAVVGTVSGTSISFGSAVVVNNAAAYSTAATFDSTNNKVVVAYRDSNNSNHGTAKVGTVSGTSISFGSAVVFQTSKVGFLTATFDSSNNKVVIAYMDDDNSDYGKAIVGTVSGTSISFGSAATFNENITQSNISAAYDDNAQKVIIAYSDGSDSSRGEAVVATVSGTSITFGSQVEFEGGIVKFISTVYDANAKKIVIAYQDDSDSDKGKLIVGTVSGTSISFGDIGADVVTFESGVTSIITAAYDSNENKVVIAYRDEGNSDHGTCVVFQNAFSNLNLTSENFIGIASNGYASGQAATINAKGFVDDNQSSLTAGQSYFVQTNGDLGTTAADPSVFAGTAVSATKLIVKG